MKSTGSAGTLTLLAPLLGALLFADATAAQTAAAPSARYPALPSETPTPAVATSYSLNRARMRILRSNACSRTSSSSVCRMQPRVKPLR